MTKETKIKMTKQLNVTDLAGEKVMVDFESGKYFLIKGVGNDIWDLIQEETTVGTIVDSLLKEYDVTAEQCEAEVVAFLEKLVDMEFISVA